MSVFCVENRIFEDRASRTYKFAGKNSEHSRKYFGIFDSPAEAWAAVNLASPDPAVNPPTVDFVELTAAKVIELTEETVAQNGIMYRFTVSYSHPSSERRNDQRGDDIVEVEADEQVDFDFGPIPKTFEVAKEQIRTEGAPDVKKLLNVGDDGAPTAYDFEPPADGFTVKKIIPRATATNAWIRARAAQRMTVNSEAFRGFEPGECMFLGFSGFVNSAGDVEITYQFAVGMNETITTIEGTDLSFGGPVNVGPFDYLWVMTEASEDESEEKAIVPKPKGGYLATLFDTSNFASLGVNTGSPPGPGGFGTDP